MADSLDLAYIKRAHGERTRQGRCRGCRADFPCQSLLAAQEIERLTFERDELARERAKWFESYMGAVRLAERSGQERDEWGGKAATASAEASAFRRQREEVVEALANLHAAVVTLTNADPTHYEVANAVGVPALVAMQLVERYRRAAALTGEPAT